MSIWVDADACPVPVKDILCRAAERCRIPVIFVANRPIRVPPSAHISTRQVAAGFDGADNEIVRLMAPGDLVVTQDIPLAAEVVEHGGEAMSPRGQAFTRETIRQRLAMRNLMEELRNNGEVTGGPDRFSRADCKQFADRLDRWTAKTRAAGSR